MDVNDIANRAIQGTGITADEQAFLITQNPHALAGFMVGNNPGSVNLLLNQLGYDHLGFKPDPTQIQRQLDILIDRNQADDFHFITSNFQVDGAKLSPEFVKALIKQHVKLS